MLRFTVFAALLTAICAIPINNIGDSETTGDVIVVTSIDEYLAQNPSAKILAELQREETPFNELRYTIGNRVNGDRVVSTATYSNNFGAPSNVASTVRYPANGVGSIVSYVSIVANQVNHSNKKPQSQ